MDSEVLERSDTRGRREPTCGPADEVLVDTGNFAVLRDIDRGETFVDGVETLGVLGQPRVRSQTFWLSCQRFFWFGGEVERRLE